MFSELAPELRGIDRRLVPRLIWPDRLALEFFVLIPMFSPMRRTSIPGMLKAGLPGATEGSGSGAGGGGAAGGGGGGAAGAVGAVGVVCFLDIKTGLPLPPFAPKPETHCGPLLANRGSTATRAAWPAALTSAGVLPAALAWASAALRACVAFCSFAAIVTRLQLRV